MNTFRSSRLQLQSNVKAGTVNGLATNHNESLKVASQVKAGIRIPNHNESLVASPAQERRSWSPRWSKRSSR